MSESTREIETTAGDSVSRGISLDRLLDSLNDKIGLKGSADSLKRRAMKGAVITIGGFGVSQALTLLSNLILTRMLAPGAFGVMSLVNVLLQGLKMFSDVGTTPAIVQSKHGDERRFLNTAWTIQVVRGFILLGGCIAMALPVAQFYEEPLLKFIVPVAGLSAVAAGFASTKLASAQRHLALGRLTLVEVASQAFGILVLVSLAAWLQSVWALAVGGIAVAIIHSTLTHLCLPGECNRFCWDRQMAVKLVRFGKWIFLATALTFVALQGDRIVLGKLIPFASLGVYSIAYMISQQPRAILSRISTQVIFPAVSRRKTMPRPELRHAISRSRWPVLVAMAALVSAMIAIGDLVVQLLWDSRYIDAAWMLPILLLGVWPRVLDQTSSVALMAIGKLQYNPIGSVCRILVIFGLLPPAYNSYGIAGAVMVIAAADVPNYLAHLLGLSLNGLGQVVQDLKATAVFAVMLLVVWGIRQAAGVEYLAIPGFAEL